MNKKTLSIGFTALLIIVTIITLIPKNDSMKLSHMTGQTMGTIGYNVKVSAVHEVEYKESIDSLLTIFNQSLSVYIPDSEISTFNQTDTLSNPSDLFLDVFYKSKEIYEQTNGTFDPTVGPLIGLWGFGPNEPLSNPDSTKIDSVLLLISLDKVTLENGLMTKDKNVQLDFGAIAKGQAVDEVSQFLENKGETNYLVEIGGEVRCKGLSEKGQAWKIGIEDPTVGLFEKELLAIIKLDGMSMATSGNYRNYYEKDGQIYAHIVDPRTGYTAKHKLLSASVLASDCMTADAFATGFMVLGLEESIQIVEEDPDLDAVFVFRSDTDIDVYVSTGITEITKLVESSSK